jgi:hypothetical protein
MSKIKIYFFNKIFYFINSIQVNLKFLLFFLSKIKYLLSKKIKNFSFYYSVSEGKKNIKSPSLKLKFFVNN